MPVFGVASLNNLSKCHPSLKLIATEAIKEMDFRVLDSTRGRDAQTRAYKTGKSKAKFGQSAHNYVPAIAFDLFPFPYDWNDRKAFIRLSKIILAMPERLGLKGLDGKTLQLRWGGDFNMDGNTSTSDAWDLPHYELHKWRDYAKNSRLYEDG